MIGGNYHKLRRLGAGGFGEVWEVRGPKGKTAMKQMRFDGLDEANQCLRESSVMLKLNHPNIVTCFETFLHREGNNLFVCITMPLFGGDLMKFVKNAPVQSSVAARVATDLSSALSYVHTEGYIHRDIKPQNIFTSTTGINTSYHLADFGLCKDESAHSRSIAGTPYYMAPEQYSGERYSSAVDQWALGVVLLVLCVPQNKIPDKRPIHMIAKKQSREAFSKLIRQLLRQYNTPSALCEIVEGLLCINPRERIRSNDLHRRLNEKISVEPQKSPLPVRKMSGQYCDPTVTNNEGKPPIKPIVETSMRRPVVVNQNHFCPPSGGIAAPIGTDPLMRNSHSPVSSPGRRSSLPSGQTISIGDCVETVGLSISELNGDKGVVIKISSTSATVVFPSGERTVPLVYLKSVINTKPDIQQPQNASSLISIKALLESSNQSDFIKQLTSEQIIQISKKIVVILSEKAAATKIKNPTASSALTAAIAICKHSEITGVKALVQSGISAPVLLILRDSNCMSSEAVIFEYTLSLASYLYSSSTHESIPGRHVTPRDVLSVLKKCLHQILPRISTACCKSLASLLRVSHLQWCSDENIISLIIQVRPSQLSSVSELFQLHSTLRRLQVPISGSDGEILDKLLLTNTTSDNSKYTLSVYRYWTDRVVNQKILDLSLSVLDKDLPGVEHAVCIIAREPSQYSKVKREVIVDLSTKFQHNNDIEGMFCSVAILRGTGPYNISAAFKSMQAASPGNPSPSLVMSVGYSCLSCGLISNHIPVYIRLLILTANSPQPVLTAVLVKYIVGGNLQLLWTHGLTPKLLVMLIDSSNKTVMRDSLMLFCAMLGIRKFCDDFDGCIVSFITGLSLEILSRCTTTTDAALGECCAKTITTCLTDHPTESQTVLLTHRNIPAIYSAHEKLCGMGTPHLKALRKRFSCTVCGKISKGMIKRERGYKCTCCIGKSSRR